MKKSANFAVLKVMDSAQIVRSESTVTVMAQISVYGVDLHQLGSVPLARAKCTRNDFTA